MGEIIGRYIMPHPPIIIPNVGKGEEQKIKKTSDCCEYIAKEISEKNVKTLVIITPHGVVFSDAIAMLVGDSVSGDLSNFSSPDTKLTFNINKILANKILVEATKLNITCAVLNKDNITNYGETFQLDHGAFVPLYFINKHNKKLKIVHITYGMLARENLFELGTAINKAVQSLNENVAVIASGDLSHKLTHEGPYGYSVQGNKFDNTISTYIKEGNLLNILKMNDSLINEAAECGYRSILVLLGTLKHHKFVGNLLSYEYPFGVGYLVAELSEIKEKDDSFMKYIRLKADDINKVRLNESIFVKLARESLEYYVNNKELMTIPSYITNEMLHLKSGVFVSLKIDNNLRGCIGTILPTTNNIAQEIIKNAVEAGVNDPRFLEVSKDELKYITYSVDVLSVPEKATKDKLNVKQYGVIVSYKGKRGLLLPNLSGVNSVDEQISIALSKAGIAENNNYIIERFKVTRYH